MEDAGRESGKERALSLGQSIIYAGGNLPAALTTGMVESWLLFFYCPPSDKNLPVYASLAAFGLISILGRVVDSVSDPVVGFWSDRTKTRWGRRRPFLLFGSPLLAVVFVLLWFPPTEGATWANNLWLVVLVCIFWFLYTVVVAPYLAILPEITPFLQERINVSAYMGVFELVGRILAGLVGVFALALREGWEPFGLKLPDAYKPSAIIGAVIVVVLYFLVIYKIRETPHRQEKEVPFGIFRAVAETFRNQPFRPYILLISILLFCAMLILAATPYIATSVMGEGEDMGTALQLILFIGAVPFFPLTAWLGGRIGKKRVFIGGLIWFAVVLPLIMTIGKWPFLDAKWQALILFMMMAPPVSVMLVLQRPILFDVIDHDEKLTGYRREAMYMGAEGFCTKLGAGLAPAVLAFLMKYYGNTADEPWGILLAGPVAAVSLLVGLFVFWRYYPFDR